MTGLTVEAKTLSSLAQAFDGRVDLRRDDDSVAVRTQGLVDQPGGWHQLDGDG